MTLNFYFIFLYKIIKIQSAIVVTVMCIFVSFSSVRLLAPRHHVLLITSLSWGPYVSQLLHQHTLGVFFVLKQEKDLKALLA